MRGVTVLGMISLVGCGGAGGGGTAIVSNDNVPVVRGGEGAETTSIVTPRAPRHPAHRTVLVDGVREAQVLDELGGFRLVGGAGMIALVGPDGHVRASHRFAFGADGANGVFLASDPRGERVSHAVVGNGDQDGFRSPWGGQLDRWNLDEDTIEELTGLGYAAPQLARVGRAVVVVSPTESGLLGVTDTGLERREESADRLGWAPGRPAECYVGMGEDTYLVRASPAGALLVSEANGPVPDGVPSAPVPAEWPMSASLGARGLPSIALAPTGGRLALGTSSSMVLLGPQGIENEVLGGGNLQWRGADALRMGEFLRPLAVPTIPRRSVLVDRVPYPQASEDGGPPEGVAFAEWQYRAGEAEASGEPIPPLALAPVCGAAPRPRCVRARVDGTMISSWEIYDAVRPTRVIAEVIEQRFPPGVGYVLVAPGGRYVRIWDGDTVAFQPLPRGPRIEGVLVWAELERGWVYVDPQDPTMLHFLSFDGHDTAHSMGEAIDALTIVDGTRVLAETAQDVRVIATPALALEQTIVLGEPVQLLHCRGDGLVDDDGADVEGSCPVPDLGEDGGWAISMTRDLAFWTDGRLGDEVHVHRVADGAEIVVRVTTQGVLVSGPDGVFEGRGAVLDHVVVREPGPVLAAAITAGPEARARFERPGLVAAFFAGQPLPTP